ncbi:hypothetical protein E2562_026550 [Oryza meyeriana var. granulata]|uniref:Uncharacterized protein n=1 Tax=Oryza meyeriana var. granulata TaxID=110450 RepID=A0A6G1CT25_9ORYZ|nr:hypothetical protein E2562_026550 [Oryza meyeriana var. granulata]
MPAPSRRRRRVDVAGDWSRPVARRGPAEERRGGGKARSCSVLALARGRGACGLQTLPKFAPARKTKIRTEHLRTSTGHPGFAIIGATPL